MSSTESSGAPAEAAATPPAPAAEFPTFGTTRGSGLARGKRSTAGSASNAAPAPTDYKPTAIEVINAPREYQNPFAPANAEPARDEHVESNQSQHVESAPGEHAEPARGEQVEPAAPAATPAAAATGETTPAPVAHAETVPASADTPAQLNILEPERQRSVPPQTWESEGFRPTREPRAERHRPDAPRHEAPAEEVDIASIPPQFLYVRPGVKFVPTPKNWGGAPRERTPRQFSGEAPAAAPAQPSATPAGSGGIFGWIKSLFGSAPAPTAAPADTQPGERSHAGRYRGGRGHGPGGEGGHRRRHRGGRGRGRGGRNGDHGGHEAT